MGRAALSMLSCGWSCLCSEGKELPDLTLSLQSGGIFSFNSSSLSCQKCHIPVLPPGWWTLSYSNDPPFSLCVVYSAKCATWRYSMSESNTCRKYSEWEALPTPFFSKYSYQIQIFPLMIVHCYFLLFSSDFVWSNSWMKGIVGPFGNYACWFSLWELDWNNRWCLNATNHNQQQNNSALRWKIDLRISSPQEERQALKPTFSVAEPCNYNISWSTGAKNTYNFTLWKKQPLWNGWFHCHNLSNSFWWLLERRTSGLHNCIPIHVSWVLTGS